MSAVRSEDDAPRGFVTMREYIRLQRRIDDLEAQLASLRDDAREASDQELIHRLRLEAGIAPQGALVLIHLARARREPVPVESLERMLGRDENHIGAVVHHANRNAMQRRGAPRLIAGHSRGSEGSGRFITAEGRAWLLERVPELFDRGSAR